MPYLISEYYKKLINSGIYKNQDYAEVRKIKFLNFTCAVSVFIVLIAALIALFDERITTTISNLFWMLFLISLIFLNHKRQFLLTRIIFITLWSIYQIASVFYLGNAPFKEYYLTINILISFILFDSFWFSLFLFLGFTFAFFGTDLLSREFLDYFLRFGSFFGVTVFFKSVIYEIEEVIKIKSKEVVEAENGRLKEKQKLVEAELTYKNQELINFAVQITQKNEFISSMNEQVNNLGKSDTDIKQVKALINANTSISKDRMEFENHVQNLYEGFYTKLDQAYPFLSPNDRKLAAFTRMGLSSKEIATIMNISPKSVDQGRYRLRQKMNLENKVNLTKVLQSI